MTLKTRYRSRQAGYPGPGHGRTAGPDRRGGPVDERHRQPGRQGGRELREQINSVLHRGRDAIERTRRGVVQRSQAAAEATEEYVEDHPWQTIAVSAGAASSSAC